VKILWLYRYHNDYNFDHWLHMDFAEAIKEYTHGDIKCYGKYLFEHYKDFCVTPWTAEMTMKKLYARFPFDVVIINTKSRMFEDYLPPINPGNVPAYSVDCWLPQDFTEYKCPKIVIEEDYHWETDDDWYAEHDISLILQRHYSQSLRDGKVKKLWFPFSVDTNVFCPSPTVAYREPRICKMGGYTDCYVFRQRVINMLKEAGIGVDFSNVHREERYVKSLKNYRAYVCCSSNVYITPAKMFEIMGSGGLLFTNNAPQDKYGLKKLFPDDSYVTYEEDFSNVISQARRIINESEWSEGVANRGMKYVREHHNHKIRISQLLEILKQEFGI